MPIKLRVYGELSAVLGTEINIDKKECTIKEILEHISRGKGFSVEDIERDYVVLLNGRVVRDKEMKISEGDELALLPIFFGGGY